ncbi:MAG: response regulator transcription factor [Actinobacteria bacterium]|nr:response regulator transcription factor [Actinomycetota bacterium]
MMQSGGFVAVYPEPPPSDLVRILDLAGYQWKAVSSAADAALHESPDGWAGAVVACDGDAEAAWSFCRALRLRDNIVPPLLVLISDQQLADLPLRADLFDDFCITTALPLEMETRLRHVLHRETRDDRPELVQYHGLVLNLETYQAAIGGTPLDLTYMEYELLKFLAQNPGKVFTREVLLSRVWGYEYYGGARTVDVHVRRLRAKLGEEHANFIETVRSVGYRFGQSRWSS